MPPLQALSPDSLYRACDAEKFSFTTTDELEDLAESIDQMRALDAARFGIAMRHSGYNLYIMGPAGIGKRFLIQKLRTAHNDSDCAVANSVVAVESAACHVQGTIDGLGERCGNANLCSVVPNLQIKLGMQCIKPEQLRRLRDVARFVNEIGNMRHFKRQPFIGDSAFAHKAGIHVSAIRKRPETYEHIRPELVGNSQRVLISDLAGKSNILRKAEEFGIRLDPDAPQIQDIVTTLKHLENEGFQFEGAEASFVLLMKKSLGLHKRFFDLIGFRTIIEKRREGASGIDKTNLECRIR